LLPHQRMSSFRGLPRNATAPRQNCQSALNSCPQAPKRADCPAVEPNTRAGLFFLGRVLASFTCLRYRLRRADADDKLSPADPREVATALALGLTNGRQLARYQAPRQWRRSSPSALSSISAPRVSDLLPKRSSRSAKPPFRKNVPPFRKNFPGCLYPSSRRRKSRPTVPIRNDGLTSTGAGAPGHGALGGIIGSPGHESENMTFYRQKQNHVL
jgi:hypothetical protein